MKVGLVLLHGSCLFSASLARIHEPHMTAKEQKAMAAAQADLPPLVFKAYEPEDDPSSFPLGLCEGDCDHDRECQEGLECYVREADSLAPVPGCSGSGDIGKDYCVMATGSDQPGPKALHMVGESPHATPLGECEGDCDTNNDCAGKLVCFKREGKEAVPGCVGTGTAKKDFCYMPAPNELVLVGNDRDPDHRFPLDACQGDCDTEEDCAPGLSCLHRSNDEPVPGCTIGKAMKGRDYCYDPNLA